MKTWRLTSKLLVVAMFCSLLWQTGVASAEPAAESPAGIRTIQIAPSDDTYVNDGAASENKSFGDAQTLRIKSMHADRNVSRQAFMKFDLKEVGGVIQSATISVYGQVTDGAGSQIGVQVHGVADNSWTEDTMTWMSKPSLGAELAAVTIGKPAGWHEIDVTGYLREQAANGEAASVGLAQNVSSGLVVDLNSKENTVNQPYLEVVFAEVEDTAAPVWPEGSSLMGGAVSPASVDLGWTDAEDDVSVTKYRIYQNGEQIAEVGGLVKTYRATGLQSSQTYTFKIEAGDSAGHWSQNGPTVTLTIPETAALQPIEDTYVNDGTASMNNFGNLDRLWVKNVNVDRNVTRQAFMKFDTGPFDGEVGTATLHFYGAVTDGGGSVIDTQLYGVENVSWSESLMTWLTKPVADHYLDAFSMDKTWKWHQVDVTSYVKSQRAGGRKTIGLGFLQQAANGLVIQIFSKENQQNQPYLELSSDRATAGAPQWDSGSALQPSNLREDGVDLNWTAANGSEDVTAYRIYRNGGLVGTVDGDTLSYSVHGLELGGRHTFKVEAGNGADQWSNDGPYLTVTIPKTELKQTSLGNVFTEGEPVKFEVATLRPNVRWTVRDMYGAVLAVGDAQTVAGTAVVEVLSPRRGYFLLEASIEEAGSEPIVLRTPFAVLSPFDVKGLQDSPFGIAAHLHRTSVGWSADLAELIAKAGAKTARGGMEWSSIEKEKGAYTFSPQPDFFMRKLKEEGVKALFVSGYNNPFYDNNGTPYTDEGREGFANYANAYAEHYRDQLAGVQVYNEFNGGFGKRGNSPANSQPDYYYKLLVKTYGTVKANNPDMPVIGMVTAGIPLGWIEEVFKLGGLEYMDVISVHPYRYPQTPEGMVKGLQDLQALIRKYNGGELKPIWISEIGWPTHQSASGVDEKTQADYLVRAHVLALANGVEKVVWYNLMNDGLQADYNEHNFGLIRFADDPLGAYTPKPAYVSYAAMARELTGASFVEQESSADGIRSYVFEKENKPLRVLWAHEDKSAAVYTDSPLAITDLSGNTETFVPYDGKVFLTLTGEPLYIKGNVERIVADGTFSIQGEEHFAGEPAGFTVRLANAADKSVSFSMDVEGVNYPLSAQKGQTAYKRLTVPNASQAGFRMAVVTLLDGEHKVGRLQYEAITRVSSEVKVRPVLEELEDGNYKQTLSVEVNNFSKTNALALKEVSWGLGGQSGQEAWNAAVSPEGTLRLSIPLNGLSLGQNHQAHVQVEFANREPFVYEGNLSFQPIGQKPGEAPTIDLSQSTVKVSNYGGDDDLSGGIWLHYDKDRFYLTAKIKDNVHAAPAKGEEIWNNDGIQFGMAYGIPGEVKEWFEYGIADTPEGPQVYRWRTTSGIDTGPAGKAEATVTRDEEQKLTVYELALPWSELAPIKPVNGESASFSLLVNDHDGTGRRGWIEWGSGIGSEKRPSLYRSMQWMQVPSPPVVNPPSSGPGSASGSGSYVSATGSLVIPPGAAGEVSLGKAVRISIPAGASVESVHFTIEELKEFEALLEEGKQPLSPVFELLKNKAGLFKKPVTLRFKYDPLPLETGQYPSVFYYDEQTERWIEIGGEADGGHITVQTDHFTKFAVFAVESKGEFPSFSDIGGHWAAMQITEAVKQGLVTGYPDSTFKPESGLTRAEFAVMLARALKLPNAAEDAKPFADDRDIPRWAKPDIYKAVQAGILEGYPDSTFDAGLEISRSEIAVMICRAAGHIGEDFAVEEDSGTETSFSDDKSIPAWAKTSAAAAAELGLMKGRSGNRFAPQMKVTRAEAVVLLLRLMDLKG
ncbi:DNRLRE domain-containing protein [Paenibacillus sp. PL91]|uniref:CBM96 family carbohydrate-binding protein n=1 Tax=Paenibacillus sp. PL91 TaxID=2729538 RepID=UPI001CB93994|nr:DNRLRE domain-containing protein [Paenibacillus sp. PL91]